MITYKTFSKQTTGISNKSTLKNQVKLRQEVANFINKEIKNDQSIINITESAITVGGTLTITIWHRVDREVNDEKRY